MNGRQNITILCGLMLGTAAHTLSAQPYFTGIGILNGDFATIARDISPEGSVVSGDTGLFGLEVILWTLEDGLRSITPGQRADTAGGISSLGRVVLGGFPGNGTRHAFRWTEETGAVSLGDLPGGEFYSAASGITPRGDIIGGGSSSDNGRCEAFRWTEETGMVPLGDLPGGLFRSGAHHISANGRVIAGTGWSEQGQEVYRWTAETGMIGLGDLPGGSFESSATGISADGSVIIGNGWKDDGQHGFRWTAETGIVALPKVHPTQAAQRIYGTSWDGNVIVGEAITAVGSGPFYWTAEDGIRWLTDVFDEHGVVVPDGWILDTALAVSADGRTIVGVGNNPQWATEGWVAYLGPACRADFDENGTVDAEDVAAYLAAWLESNIFADWDYDGSINTRDLLGFFNEWVAQPGCE